jgi:hypothetical protein
MPMSIPALSAINPLASMNISQMAQSQMKGINYNSMQNNNSNSLKFDPTK